MGMKLIKVLSVVLLTAFFTINGHAQTKVATGEQIINEAKAEAAKTNKNVFVIFHASWCIWCHRMDTAMNDESVKSFFDKSYVISHLTVDERGEKEKLDNPGANELRTQYGGDQQGIPFWFIIDKNGKLLADSRLHSADGKVSGNNVGCPAQPEEVEYFINVLKKTSTLDDAQLALIRTRFLKIGQ